MSAQLQFPEELVELRLAAATNLNELLASLQIAPPSSSPGFFFFFANYATHTQTNFYWANEQKR